MKAIETKYNGYRFRSRLEARWAVFLDALHVEWDYEREGYDLGEAGWYLPDFWLPLNRFWIEIKAADFDKKAADDAIWKAGQLATQSGERAVLCTGLPGDNSAIVFEPNMRSGPFQGQTIFFGGWFGLCPRCATFSLLTDLGVRERGTVMLLCPICEGAHTGDVPSSHEHYWQGAIEAARSARFEHGETPKVPRGRPR